MKYIFIICIALFNFIISSFGQNDKSEKYDYNKLRVVVSSKSNSPVAGSIYEAEVMLVGNTSNMEIIGMKLSGREILIVNGVGKIKFRVTGGKYNAEGIVKKSYKALIDVRNKKNAELSTVEHSEFYNVVKPTLKVESTLDNTLFLNCGNHLKISCPALEPNYNPSFRATGATIILGANKGELTVIPTQSNVVISVSSGGMRIDELRYKVSRIPSPQVFLLVGRKPIDFINGEVVPGPTSLHLKVLPDPFFKLVYPRDARYKITKWEASLFRGVDIVKKMVFYKEIGVLNRDIGVLSSISDLAQPGDRIMVEIIQVKRLDFRAQTEDVTILNKVFNIPIISRDEKSKIEAEAEKAVIKIVEEGILKEKSIDTDSIEMKLIESIVVEEEQEAPVMYAEVNAEHEKGRNYFYKIVSTYCNENYPISAKKAGVQGKVYVSFIIEKNGDLSNVKVIKGVHEDIDKVAIEAIIYAGKWSPAKQGGRLVRQMMRLPVAFRF